MKPLIVLIGSFLMLLLLSRLIRKPMHFQLAARLAMSIMLFFTAIGHFLYTDGMAAMVPDFIPFPSQVVIATGFLEIGFAIGLLLPAYQKMVAWALIAFLFLVLPANIKASIENVNFQTGAANGPGLSYLWFRIPLQIFFVLWVYLSAIKNASSQKKEYNNLKVLKNWIRRYRIVDRHRNPLGIFLRVPVYITLFFALWQHHIVLILVCLSCEIFLWLFMPPVKKTCSFIERAIAVEIIWLQSPETAVKILSYALLLLAVPLVVIGLWNNDIYLTSSGFFLFIIFNVLMNHFARKN